MELIIGVLVFTISLVTSLSVVKPVYPEKSEAVLWQETGLNPDQLSSFLTNQNCHENEKKFLACINAIGKISKEQLDEVADKALNDGSIIYNPKEATFKDLKSILEKAW